MNLTRKSFITSAATLAALAAFPGSLALADGVAQAPVAFAGGTGTRKDPYKIETAEQLAAVNNDLAASYVLVSDIDLAGYESFPIIGTYVMDENSESGEDPLPELVFRHRHLDFCTYEFGDF